MHSRFRTTEMERKPLSILVLTHNRPEMLKQAMESINGGAIPNSYVVLLNNGDAIELDPSWNVDYHHIPGLGLTESYKYLIDQAKGEYSIFLEDDDKLKLEEPWQNMIVYDHDIYLHNFVVKDEVANKFYPVEIWEDKEFTAKEFLLSMYDYDTKGEFHLSQMIFRTSLAKQIDFPDSNVIGMDEYFLHRLVTLSKTVFTSGKPGHIARVHGNNLSWNNYANIKANFKVPLRLVHPYVYDFLEEQDSIAFFTKLGEMHEQKLFSTEDKLRST